MTEAKKENIKVRIAPSPTGNLHIGTARTALFNWFFAKHEGGKFILRIEDTDTERSKKEFEDDIVKGLEWLGLKSDEFYRQSDRIKIYSKYIKKLLENKKAFWCYHSEEELEVERNQQMKMKSAPVHNCSYKTASDGVKKEGVIRLAVDQRSTRKIKFNDIIRGEIEFNESLIGDFSIAKDEDHALYHFAVVVDDYETDITHIIRGEDHIANTAKHILIQEALGFSMPQYAHMPMILSPDRSKLSKRHGATSLLEYREMGYLPKAIVNYLALLGWTPKEEKELMSEDEIIKDFNLEGVHKSGAIFDIKKLNWLNGQYIKMEKEDSLAGLVMPFIEKYFGSQEKGDVMRALPLIRERLEYLDQVKEFHYFFKEPEYEGSLLVWKSSTTEEIKESLSQVKKIIDDIGVDDKAVLADKLNNLYPDNRGLAYWPLRVALSGEKSSPDPVDIAVIIGKERTLKRVLVAIDKLS